MVIAIFFGVLISMAIGFLTYAGVDVWLIDSTYSYETDKKIR